MPVSKTILPVDSDSEDCDVEMECKSLFKKSSNKAKCELNRESSVSSDSNTEILGANSEIKRIKSKTIEADSDDSSKKRSSSSENDVQSDVKLKKRHKISKASISDNFDNSERKKSGKNDMTTDNNRKILMQSKVKHGVSKGDSDSSSNEDNEANITENVVNNDSGNDAGKVSSILSESEGEIIVKTKKKININKSLIDSDSDNSNSLVKNRNEDVKSSDSSDESNSDIKTNSKTNKSRIIRAMDTEDEDDSDESKSLVESNKSKSNRIKNKRTTMTNKFKNRFSKTVNNVAIINARDKSEEKTHEKLPLLSKSMSSGLYDPESSSDEETTQNDIAAKQLTKNIPLKSNISNLYDSESSDDDKMNDKSRNKNDYQTEETVATKVKNLKKSGAKHNSNNDTAVEPKAQRMSAKQAMEQMKMIKSESGRMLREKQVELPYHKPKQITLKDILERKKINTTTGNQRLSLRMNEQQLKEYAKQLEEREKEMIELCKSESEEEEEAVQESEATVNQTEKTSNNTNNPEDITTANSSDIANTRKNLLTQFDEVEESTAVTSVQNNSESTSIEKFEDNLENIQESLNKSDEMIDSQNTEELFNLPSTSKEVNEIETKELMEGSAGVSQINIKDNSSGDTKIVKSVSEGETSSFTNKSNDGLDDIEMCDEEGDYNIDQESGKCKKNDSKDTEIINFKESELFMKYNSKSQPNYQSGPKLLSQQIECSLPNVKPKLTGSPGCFIDFSSEPVKESGLELLKKRFLIHSAMKTTLEMERGKEKKIQPGACLMKLKRDLEEQISERRSQEWAKRIEEENQRKQELKELNGGDLSECEDMLEDETKKYEVSKNEEGKEEIDDKSSSDEESEEEEMDVVIKDKKRKDTCGFIDEEAELDDENDSGDENEDESSSESDDDLVTDPQAVKKTRILKAFEDSDSSDAENVEVKIDNVKSSQVDSEKNNLMSTPSKARTYSSDMFSSQVVDKNESFSQDWEDELPLGQKCMAPDRTPILKWSESGGSDCFINAGANRQGRSDLVNLVSPLIKLTAVQRITSETDSILDQSMSPNSSTFASSPKTTSPHAEGKWINLQKKLFMDSEGLQDSQELANLCSGKFPTQLANTATQNFIEDKISMSGLFCDNQSKNTDELTQNTENELMELCTGKFVGINDSAENRTITNNTSMETEKICLSWSEPVNSETINVANAYNNSPMSNSDFLNPSIANSTSNVVKSPPKSSAVTENSQVTKDVNIVHKSKVKSIQSFFQPKSKEQLKTTTNADVTKDIPEPSEPLMHKKKYAILSSSDEMPLDQDDNENSAKKKVLKSKKERNKMKSRRARPLQISDDDETGEEDEDLDSDNMSDANLGENDEKIVEYDSEENEIEALPDIAPQKPKRPKTSEFFDQEAELTSEDEWKGSGDEDERGLDVLEWEEGDADQFDQGAVKKQLEKIHMREVLDQDKREVRLLQEMLLEDGDLEGGTRERKFRWKNVDSGIESGAIVGDEDIDGLGEEEFQSEEQWRRQRHERETFLRQMEKENSTKHIPSQLSQESVSYIKTVTRTSLIKKSNRVVKPTINQQITDEREQSEGKSSKLIKDLPSPIKKPFALQSNVRGSFLSRGQGALNRLALLTKNGPQINDDKPKNLSSLAPGKKGNFVFAAVSPPCRETMEEEVKLAKRKAASDISTPALIKKIRVNEGSTLKSRKSLMDHID